jgi:hypothetical protein
MALSVRYFSYHSRAELIRIFLVFCKKVAVIQYIRKGFRQLNVFREDAESVFAPDVLF